MTDRPGLLERITTGRLLKRGLTVSSGVITLVVILAAMIGFSLYLKSRQEPFQLFATVLDHEVVAEDGECSWTFQIELVNREERQMSVMSARIEGVENSERAIVATVKPDETVERTYRYPLADCSTTPAGFDAQELVVRFRPFGSSLNETVSTPIPAG